MVEVNTEKTKLLQEYQQSQGTESLRLLFDRGSSTAQLRPEEESFRVPIHQDEDAVPDHHQGFCSRWWFRCRGSRGEDHNATAIKWMIGTGVGSILFCVYHIVFCLAQAAGIHTTSVTTGELAQLSALGVILAGPVYVHQLGEFIPAIYPTTDLFLAPFLAQIAESIDQVLNASTTIDDDNNNNKHQIFLTTFIVVTAGLGLVLSGILCIVAARVKLANLGLFLPYSVLCGFFAAVGIMMWMLGFTVDTGMRVSTVLLSFDSNIISYALLHHTPSIILGILMHLLNRQHPYWVLGIMFATIFSAYVLLWITQTSLLEATSQNWFFSVNDLVKSSVTKSLSIKNYGPPLPLGAWIATRRGQIVWEAVYAASPHVLALALLYLIRCSLHAAAVKKNLPNLLAARNASKTTSTNDKSPSPRRNTSKQRANRRREQERKKEVLSLGYILEHGYGYSQLAAAVFGAVAVSPSVAASGTMVQLGAGHAAPQYGSCLFMLAIYLTDFRIVQYIPKPAFSSLLILSGIDMTRTWLVGSFSKTKDKIEWMVAPLLVLLAFWVGMLPAIFLGIAISTLIFAANFYNAGTVKFVGSGLTLRSPVERGLRESNWLDQNADCIQILVLQSYLFFGNAQSVATYITTMFEEEEEETPGDVDGFVYALPPQPRFIVVDFTLLTGVDTSAIDVFREIVEMCKTNRCKMFLSGLTPILKAKFQYAGVQSDSSRYSIAFIHDLETALSKAEDCLLSEELQVEEMVKSETRLRRHRRRESKIDDGFLYALQKIDEQHDTSSEEELKGLRPYTLPVEILAGDVLDRDGDNSGLYFVETGLMRVTSNAGIYSTVNTTNRIKFSLADPTYSISQLNARGSTQAKQSAKLKERHMVQETGQSFRLARIGKGWIIGNIGAFAQSTRNTGVYVAITDCRLHFLSYRSIMDIENSNPALAMHLYKLMSLLSSKRQESTITQLAQFVKIMKNPLPKLRGGKKELAQLTINSL